MTSHAERPPVPNEATLQHVTAHRVPASTRSSLGRVVAFAASHLPRLPRLTLPALCVAMVFSVAACSKSSNDAAQKPATPTVSVKTLHAARIEIIDDLSGRLSATQVSDVRPQVDGVITKRLFVEGSTVKAGQPLYQLDPASYQASYDNARGTLAKAEATARAADITAKRYQALLQVKGVSQQDVENYVAAADEARADVVADRGLLETARINLERTQIVAPISGRIGKSSYTAGALVTADQTTALSTIQSIDEMYLDVTRSSAEALRLQKAISSGQLKPGDVAVTLTTEDGEPYPNTGRLLFTDITVDSTTGSVTLRSVFPNPKHELLPGMFVHAKFSEGSQDSAILVPQNLVTRGSSGASTVLVVDQSNTVQSRSVVADTAYGDQWVVKSGLKDGDRVVLDNLQTVNAGSKVQPVEQTQAASTAPAASDATTTATPAAASAAQG
ncbi:efflux RND transporter periplasmic adaptor subunit [Paraburkholderia sp.]|uniref:efflux RND transporter periplasmic adaptor subunit n=1 Tax=Paraburkholderia sp. TaxID=1926495 RepID=UPI00239B1AC0|nr:efflux RND transporter periplasmic adaptor subunit [Paraburkholderia sp.]MDE1181104.1 efflux RND transporter periplasmic adaptor subunit [Paraburkholderia sp.]